MYLLPMLARRGDRVIALTRSLDRVRATPHFDHLQDCAQWRQADVSRDGGLPAGADTLIHIAPLALLPPLIPAFAACGGRRLVAFGTTSLYSKSASDDARERALAERVADAESSVARLCAAHGIAWTVLRPTLVYGAGMDRNVTLIAALIRRLRCFPLFGPARGLRQPVHAADLAEACLRALDQPATIGRAYNLAGGETLDYREMVRRIFIALGRTPRFVRVPLPLFRLAMWCIARLPRYRDFNPEMARRMNHDLVFDCSDAERDFGFAPRRFQPRFDGRDGQSG
ncbi:MAG: NAD-dependent epimerase/dehydratase family protein [Burkholderiales bacterium]|nr:NAD-dependent epimerase/dehydratase family protein [Rhodocyclaceae bacterium]MBP8295241.1 NAD-dependent epimerase/dehydratase family protein [Burkholderiales bacterium]